MVFDHDGNLVASAPQFDEALVVCDLAIRPTFRKRLLDPRGHEGMASLPFDDGLRQPVPAGAMPWSRTQRSAPLAPRLGPRCGGLPGARARDVRLRPQERLHRRAGRLCRVGSTRRSWPRSRPTPSARDRVHGVLMPSRFSSTGSVDDASALGANLGIDTTTVGIEPAHRVLLEMLAPVFDTGDPAAGLAGREPSGPHPGRHPHGDLERAGLARAHDGQQERDGCRLRHAVRRHGGRLRAC